MARKKNNIEESYKNIPEEWWHCTQFACNIQIMEEHIFLILPHRFSCCFIKNCKKKNKWRIFMATAFWRIAFEVSNLNITNMCVCSLIYFVWFRWKNSPKNFNLILLKTSKNTWFCIGYADFFALHRVMFSKHIRIVANHNACHLSIGYLEK